VCSSDLKAGETIEVIHVADFVEEGREVYVMGPKTIYGEHIDGVVQNELPPYFEDALIPIFYNGAVITSPALDFNYNITTITFKEAGIHTIVWQPGDYSSNTLEIEIVP
jgi:hypothetical protein